MSEYLKDETLDTIAELVTKLIEDHPLSNYTHLPKRELELALGARTVLKMRGGNLAKEDLARILKFALLPVDDVNVLLAFLV